MIRHLFGGGENAQCGHVENYQELVPDGKRVIDCGQLHILAEVLL
jgi:hypothetical protein